MSSSSTDKWLVVGIGGASCSGKTTIANMLKNLFPETVTVIHQDDYYHPIGSDKLEYIEELKFHNWDVPSAFDLDRLLSDIKKIIRNESSDQTDGRKILIVEGILIYAFDQIFDLCVLKYFFTITKSAMHRRKLERGYKRFDPVYIDRIVWPMYEYYKSVALSKIVHQDDIVVLDGLRDLDVNVERIAECIRSISS